MSRVARTAKRRGFGRASFVCVSYATLARMKAIAILLALIGASVPAFGQAPSEQPIRTTLCEIKAHPENFQHKLVEFRATASHGFEDSMVEDSACPWPENKNPGVWMEFGGTHSTDTMYCCGFSPKPVRPATLKVDGMEIPLVDDDLFKKFDSALHADPKPKQSVTVDAILRGRIFARRKTINKDEYWGGYGHMGCCMLFVVTQVLSVGHVGTRPD
jgi:hypothetical protein